MKHLRVVLEIAERGTFSAAAEELRYTQGAVSQQVAALERQIGMPVFVRGTRPLVLTPAGRVLHEHAKAIMEHLESAERELQAHGGLRAGTIQLASFTSATVAVGAQAVAEFRRRHPDVAVRLVAADPPENVLSLMEGRTELAITFDYDVAPVPLAADLERIELFEDRMLLAMAADHPLAYDTALTLRELADETWISGTYGPCVAALETACAAAGFTPRIGFRSDDYAVVQALVEVGVGVAMIPNLVTASLLDGVVVRPLGAELPVRRIGVVRHVADRSPTTAAMLDVLHAMRRQTPALLRAAA